MPGWSSGRSATVQLFVAALCALCPLVGTSSRASAMTGADAADASTLDRSARSVGADAERRALYEEFLRRYGTPREAGSEARAGMGTALAVHSSSAIPGFARKYGLPCSACHTIWPQLNNFGQVFRDNGYRLKNERDSPIDHAPGYWPVAARITPQFRVDRTTNQPVDATAGDPASGHVGRTITQAGFDLSGLDLLMLGTLSDNISFGLIPSSDNQGSFHLEAAYVRFNDLLNSNWVNLKVGKFELDNLVSEKRELLLSGNGGFYQSYHFVPAGVLVPPADSTQTAMPLRSGSAFGLGDNQLGAEFSGHSVNSYTRFSVGLFSSTDGQVGLPQGSGFDAAVAVSQAFDAGDLGLERIGVFGYRGSRPTEMSTYGGQPVPGTGDDNQSFYRAGVAGDFYLGNLELLPLFMRASDDRALAIAGGGLPLAPIPVGAQSPVWNAGFLEAHYFVGHQFVVMGRREAIRVTTQTLPDFPSDLGNVDATAVGFRWNPFMLSRTGLALHGEYAWTSTTGLPPLSGLGSGVPPLDMETRVKSSSIYLALDFAF